MQVKKIVVGALEENCYVIVNSFKEALIIDPGDEADKILDFVKDYSVVGILVTHSHFDHIGALKKLEDTFSIKANESNVFSYEVIKTPGHTSDSVSFYFPSLNALFVGDFIFLNGIGRMDLGGNAIDMKNSLHMFLKRFSDDVILYPGHGDSTTLKQERNFLENVINFL